MKKLREKLNNKKGFTLVELIVVIVIILVLSAVLVPNVIKYIEKANKANCQSEASTILTELEAQYADDYADAIRDGKTFSASTYMPSASINGKAGTNEYASEPSDTYNYTFKVEKGDDGDYTITKFSYANANYYVSWENGKWTDPVRKS